jgi:tryptophanyl-tRNA synthetase
MRKRILTGDRPTGKLHLGHYVGSLQNRVKLQHDYETFIMVADVQGLTDNFDNPQKIHDNVKEVVLDNLAVGIDPNITTIFIQSMIPQIAELTIFYANLVTVARLGHNPTVKTEMKEKGMEESVPLGFFMYPVSQAADISFIGAHLVPVGRDQAPMIEQTQEIVDKFNAIYGEILVRPEGYYSEIGRLVGTDGNAKMSKYLGNCIYLSDAPEEVEKKVRGMYTDPNRKKATDPGTVEGNPVFIYHDAFNTNKNEIEDLKERYRKGTVGDVEVKQKLTKVLNEFLAPIREKRSYYENHIHEVDEIIQAGITKTKKIAEENMEKIREVMKIKYSFIQR